MRRQGLRSADPGAPSTWLDSRALSAVVLAVSLWLTLAIPATSRTPLVRQLSTPDVSAICSPDMHATGYLTTNGSFNSTSGSPTKLDTANGDLKSSLTVYGYISQLNGTNDGGAAGDKDCGNPVYRYEGLAWLTNSTTATLDWGSIAANGNSAGCYPLWGTTDYLHANSTTTCVWTLGQSPGINYHVLGVSLSPSDITYQRNASGLVNRGDFEFVFNSCSTYYQDASGTGEVLKTGVAKSNLSAQNTQATIGPGANCGNLLTQDNTDTAQSFIDDAYDPAMTSVTNNAGTDSWALSSTDALIWVDGTSAGSVTLTPSGTDTAGSTNSGVKDYTFQAMAGTTTGWSPTAAVTQTGARTYSWTNALTNNQAPTVDVTVNDKSGRTDGTPITITLKSDELAPAIAITSPPAGTTYQSSTAATVSWTESESGSGIATRSLQRWISTTGVSGTYTQDNSTGGLYTGASPNNQTLAEGGCYYWVQTTTDHVGLAAPQTSGKICVDSSPPTSALTSPVANQVEHGVVDVSGTATDAGTFRDWTLEAGVGAAPSTWTTVASGSNQVTGAFIGDWDTRSLSGVNTLRLTVRDWAGHTSQSSSTVFLENSERGAEPYRMDVPFGMGGGWDLAIATDTGEARLSRSLFDIPSFGPDQSLSLTYSSLLQDGNGRFGTGWMSNLTQYLTFENGYVVWHRSDGARVPFGLVGGAWKPLSGHFEVLTRGQTEDTITLPDQARLVFEDTGSGRLKRIENRFGKALTLVWNSGSATATDASGRVTNIVIDSTKNRITDVTDSAGRHWTFGYAAGSGTDLISITDPAGKVTNLAYDANHDLTTVTRTRTSASGPAGTITWTIGYTNGKATTVTDPVNQSASNSITYNGDQTIVQLLQIYSPVTTDATTYSRVFTGPGWVTSVSDAAGFTSTFTYDASSRLISAARPVDAGPPATYSTSTYTYDTKGNALTRVDQLDGNVFSTTVNSYNVTNDLQTRSTADNDSNVRMITLFSYDSAGHLISTDVNCTSAGTSPPVDPSTCTGAGTQDASTNLRSTFTYTTNDQLQDLTDPLGRVTHHVYDANGNPTSTVENYQASGSGADVNVTTINTFDQATTAGKAGLITATTDPLGVTTTYAYDPMGDRLIETLPGDATIPAGAITKTFDEFGNVLTETVSWTGASRTTTHVYDAANRETSVTDATGVTTSTSYDAAGNATSISSEGVTRVQTFDGLGRMTTDTVGGATTNHTYNAAGDEVQLVDPTGLTVTKTYDRAGRVLTETLAGNTKVFTYDTAGRVITETDPLGVVTSHGYDRVGRETSKTVAGAVTSTVYDRAGNKVSVRNPSGDVEGFVIDGLDRVTAAIANCTNSGTTQPGVGVACTGAGTHDTSTNVTSTTYFDAAGHVLATKDPLGMVTRSFINARGLAWKTVTNCTDNGSSPPSDPASCGGAGTADTHTNLVGTTTFDGAAEAISTTQALGTGSSITTQAAYDAAGRVTASTDPRGTITRRFFDANGLLVKVVLNCTSSGTTIPTDWAGCSGAGTQDGTFNVTTSTTIDAHGNKATEVAPNGRVTSFTYDGADRLIAQTQNYVSGSPTSSDQNLTTYFAYDSSGRLTATRAPTTDRATFSVTRELYDGDGRLVTEIHNCTNTGTTPPGDPAWKTCTGGGKSDVQTNLVATYAYDARGNVVSVTSSDPSDGATGAQHSVTSDYAYDAEDRQCRVLEVASVDLQTLANPCTTSVTGGTSSNLNTTYTYDALGRLVSTVDARGDATTFGYDTNGHTTSVTDARNKTVTWTYDALGNQLMQSNRDGTSIAWTYDGAGHTLSRTATGLPTITYSFDSNGNALSTSDGTRTITTSYDRLNRPLTVTTSNDSGAGTTYTYGLTTAAWTDPTGAYLASLDAFGRQVALTDPIHGGSSWQSTYRADGAPSTMTAPNGNVSTFAYDNASRLSSISTATGATSRASFTYVVNRAGTRLSEAAQISGGTSNGTVTFGYDQASRLTSYGGGPTTSQAFGWDKVPNRVGKQVGNGPNVTTTYDVTNRPTVDSAGGSYSSDDDGRLTSMPGLQLIWDSLGRLTQVKSSGGTVLATYAYDPLDRLSSVTRGSGVLTLRYVGRTSTVAQGLDGSGAVLWNVVTDSSGVGLMDFGPGGTNQRFYGRNGHGDITWIADATGAVSGSNRYDPWGSITSTTGAAMPDFGFQGSWTDTATGMEYAVNRWYVPSLGRFASEDPVRNADPTRSHLYTYGAGEPVGRSDPDGRRGLYLTTATSYFDIAAYYYGDHPMTVAPQIGTLNGVSVNYYNAKTTYLLAKTYYEMPTYAWNSVKWQHYQVYRRDDPYLDESGTSFGLPLLKDQGDPWVSGWRAWQPKLLAPPPNDCYCWPEPPYVATPYGGGRFTWAHGYQKTTWAAGIVWLEAGYYRLDKLGGTYWDGDLGGFSPQVTPINERATKTDYQYGQFVTEWLNYNIGWQVNSPFPPSWFITRLSVKSGGSSNTHGSVTSYRDILEWTDVWGQTAESYWFPGPRDYMHFNVWIPRAWGKVTNFSASGSITWWTDGSGGLTFDISMPPTGAVWLATAK